MAADKVPSITESALSNDNKRTVLHAVLGPGATTYPHYHTLFSETFTLHKGPLTVYTSPDMSEASLEAKTLEVGESVTVPPKQLHYFLVGGGGSNRHDDLRTRSLGFRARYVDHAWDTK